MFKKQLGLFLFATILSSLPVSAADYTELTKRNYEDSGKEKAVLILQVNWGRYWKCAGLDNAQLQALQFARLSSTEAKPNSTTISLAAPSRLFVKDAFVPYALLIEPGEYALSAFDVKVARSASDVWHLKGGTGELYKDGKPVGGTFTAGSGEIVYIGHFGLDCAKEPIPWRYYVEGRNEFERYVAGFRKEFPFVKDTPVQFRLFSTTMFGAAYSLE